MFKKLWSNINVIDDINSTPLIYAILYNKQNSIKYLIENGANLEHEDFLGNSPSNLLKSLNKQISKRYLFYSYLKASIGFNLAAFLAGKYPKIIPIKVENTKDIIII